MILNVIFTMFFRTEGQPVVKRLHLSDIEHIIERDILDTTDDKAHFLLQLGLVPLTPDRRKGNTLLLFALLSLCSANEVVKP